MANQNPRNVSKSSSCSISLEMTDLKTSEKLANRGNQKPVSPEIDTTQLLDNSDIAGTSRKSLITEKEMVAPTISTYSTNLDETELKKSKMQDFHSNPLSSSGDTESYKTAEFGESYVSEAETEFVVSSGSTNLGNVEESTLKRRISDTREPNLDQDSFNFAEPNETTPLLGNPVSETNGTNFERTSQVSERNSEEETRRSRRLNRFLRWFDLTAFGNYLYENWVLIAFFSLLVLIFILLKIFLGDSVDSPIYM